MHTHTFTTKFTFGERVRFNSPTQGQSGEGRIFAITVDELEQIDYIIAVKDGDYDELYAGILENEIALQRREN